MAAPVPREVLVRSVLERGRRAVVHVPADGLVWEAARIMAKAEIGCVLVTNPDQTWGVVSERDIVRGVVAKGLDPALVRVRDIMRPVAPRVSLDATVRSAMRYLTQIERRHAIVVSQGRLVGVVSLHDLARRMTHDAVGVGPDAP